MTRALDMRLPDDEAAAGLRPIAPTDPADGSWPIDGGRAIGRYHAADGGWPAGTDRAADEGRAGGGCWPQRTDGGFPERCRPGDGSTNDDARLGDASSDHARRNAAWRGDYTWQDYPPSDHAWYNAAWRDDDARQDDSPGGRARQDDPWQVDAWQDDDAWDDGSSSDDAWQDDNAEDDDGDTGPYPLTYERDDFVASANGSAVGPTTASAGPWETWRCAPDASAAAASGADRGSRDTGLSAATTAWQTWGPSAAREPGGDGASSLPADEAAEPVAEGRQADRWQAGGWQAGFTGLDSPDAAGTAPGHGLTDGVPAGWDSAVPDSAGLGRGRRGGRRWPTLAGIVGVGAAVGAVTVLLASPGTQTGRGDGGPAAPTATRATPGATAGAGTTGTPSAVAAPITLAQAQAAVSRYTTVNNSANAQRSDALLATVEAGSSYAIDAGLYQAQQGTAPYPAFAPARADYYIPRAEPASGPRWFAVLVANAFSSDPEKVTSSEYLLFTQAAPGGPWLDTAEPYLLPGGNAPRIALGADGLATAVGPDAASVTVAPARLPAAAAAAADGTAAGSGQGAVAVPGNLADVSDQRFWQDKLAGATVTDAHSPAPGAGGQVFALRTADGGALVFYADAARVTITPPPGAVLHLSVPGFYSPGQSLSRAGLGYLEQFAAYDPPAAAGQAPDVVADYSAIIGTS